MDVQNSSRLDTEDLCLIKIERSATYSNFSDNSGISSSELINRCGF